VYAYRAAVTRVVDGNTIYVDVDMGFDLRQKMKLRLAGMPAKDFVEAALPAGNPVVMTTHKLGKFGPYVADVCYLPGESDAQEISANGKHLNQQLLDEGLAERVDYD
jgi:endonuclease YncB( thermonuclease family)|tara:strand:+ start:92 stop:412 length:321 start_codon:yes stop_codon:yes gene_type:complete